jgi:hypothetical protein
LTKDVAQDIEYVVHVDTADNDRDCRKEHGLMIQRRDEATNALRAADADLQKCKAALSAARVCYTSIGHIADLLAGTRQGKRWYQNVGREGKEIRR